jgi:putative endonuclease
MILGLKPKIRHDLMAKRSPTPGRPAHPERPGRQERQQRYRTGHTAEFVAAAFLMARGHRILARRFKTPVGEIDLITLKGGRVGFVEVKRRATLAECEASITPKLRQRVRRASDQWLARNTKHQSRDLGFDLLFVLPWQLPVHLRDAL